MTHNVNPDLHSLLFYTHNVARALKPSVDGELAHAIHETLHFALDGEPEDYHVQSSSKSNGRPCVDVTGQNAEASTSALPVGDDDDEDEEQIRPGFFATEVEERPFISYDWEESYRTLILPHPKTVTNPAVMDPCINTEEGKGVRDAFDVTAKFFFLGQESQEEQSYSVEWVNEALKRFAVATGLDTVDTLILAFGEMGGNHASASKVEKIASLWKQLSPNEKILSMGLSDFSQSSLQSLVGKLQLGECATTSYLLQSQPPKNKSSMTSQVKQSLASNDVSSVEANIIGPTHVHIPSSPSKAAFTELAGEGEEEALKAYGPGECRRPRLCAINLNGQANSGVNGDASVARSASSPSNGNGNRNVNASCCWDSGLADYCKENKILLVAHSDRKDILPARTLPTLMKEFDGKLPYPLPKGKRLLPLWCFKYTVLIRDRGVLADKGFLLYAEVVDA